VGNRITAINKRKPRKAYEGVYLKCLVIGASGLVGRELASRLAEKHETAVTFLSNPIDIAGVEAHRLDLANPESATELISLLKPEMVFHLAANPSVDWHEREQAAAYAVNVASSIAISRKTRELGIKLAYLSSAFVFPGFGKTYSEDDIPAPINFYGTTKAAAESAVRANPNHIIVRTDQVYGPHNPGQKKSFVVSTLEKISQGKKAEVCRDWMNCPTYYADLAAVLMRLAISEKTGTYHAAGPDFIDRYDWALRIAAAYGKDAALVHGIESATLNLPAKRPNVRLSCGKLLRETGIRMKGVNEGLEEMMRHV
jgi:dTDP-4-dehydrorhamnose reductase